MSALKRHPVAVIVLAQLFGTSLWFSPNSAAEDLIRVWQLSNALLGYLTSAVQFGFIAGTLFLAASGIADRFSASRIFSSSCVLGATFNALFALVAGNIQEAVILRFCVGVCLAGIYPLGMKMVISWTKGNAGSTLGLLVGMLTIGTALPHAVRAVGAQLSWQVVILTSSFLALTAAAAVFSLGDGSYLARAGKHAKLKWGASFSAFKFKDFRVAAVGYFGHMWELYAFWTVAPFLVADVVRQSGIPPDSQALAISSLSFVVIGIGAVGCVGAGLMSNRWGSARVAATALAISGTVCLLYPMLDNAGAFIRMAALLIWGVTVIADSAQFSAISAKACPPELVGSALAIQNSAGFFITILSITLVTSSIEVIGSRVGWLLLPGPIVGLLFFKSLLTKRR